MGLLLTSRGKKSFQIENKYFCCNGLGNMGVSSLQRKIMKWPSPGEASSPLGCLSLLTREGDKEKEGDSVAGDNGSS